MYQSGQCFCLLILQFIGACKDPFMVIVTELLPGMSLRKYLVSIRPKQLDLYVAINFALDVARAMDCLHANGIIHRDLKPGIVRICSRIYFLTFMLVSKFRVQSSFMVSIIMWIHLNITMIKPCTSLLSKRACIWNHATFIYHLYDSAIGKVTFY